MTQLERITSRRTRIGLVAGGLGAYRPEFPELLPQLQASARRVSERFAALDCDLIVGFLRTYMTASMLVPVAQRSGSPVLLLNLQIGNTTSRVDFGCDPGEWTDAWSASGVAQHRALGTGHRAADLAAVADLLKLDPTVVSP